MIESSPVLRILTYHRVAEPDGTSLFDPRMISATPEAFALQMRWLARRYTVVSMGRVLEAVEGGAALPPRAVLVTFDDAYHDFADHAWPVLRSLCLPATLFVPTAFPDDPVRPFWWDRIFHAVHRGEREDLRLAGLPPLPLGSAEDRAGSLRRLQDHLKSLPHVEAMALVDEICAGANGDRPDNARVTLDWDELRRLSAEGVVLGAHTRTHPMMTRITPEQIRSEVTESQADLRREVGQVLPIFCYPSGGHDDAVVQILREEGFRLAFTTLDGHNDLARIDPLRLRRTNITRRTTPALLRLRLQRWFAWVDRMRHR